MTDFFNSIQVGTIVDAKDKLDKWLHAEVISKDGRKCKVHFLFWLTYHNEWVNDVDIKPRGTMMKNVYEQVLCRLDHYISTPRFECDEFLALTEVMNLGHTLGFEITRQSLERAQVEITRRRYLMMALPKDFKIGDRVDARNGNIWHDAEIQEIQGDKYIVRDLYDRYLYQAQNIAKRGTFVKDRFALAKEFLSSLLRKDLESFRTQSTMKTFTDLQEVKDLELMFGFDLSCNVDVIERALAKLDLLTQKQVPEMNEPFLRRDISWIGIYPIPQDLSPPVPPYVESEFKAPPEFKADCIQEPEYEICTFKIKVTEKDLVCDGKHVLMILSLSTAQRDYIIFDNPLLNEEIHFLLKHPNPGQWNHAIFHNGENNGTSSLKIQGSVFPNIKSLPFRNIGLLLTVFTN